MEDARRQAADAVAAYVGEDNLEVTDYTVEFEFNYHMLLGGNLGFSGRAYITIFDQ